VSFTGAFHVFAGVDEDGINDLVSAFFAARPHYLLYGTSPFVPASSVTETQVPPIAFPGIGGGIRYMVRFSVPTIDLFPPDGPLPPPLALTANHLVIRTAVRLTLLCGDLRHQKEGQLTPLSTMLEVWAVGEPVVHVFGPGSGEIGFKIDAVEIVDIAPESLETLLNCLLKMLLQAALSNLWLPFAPLTAGAFSLTLDHGPEIADDQIKLWGHV
jgi:hypothetical protein